MDPIWFLEYLPWWNGWEFLKNYFGVSLKAKTRTLKEIFEEFFGKKPWFFKLWRTFEGVKPMIFTDFILNVFQCKGFDFYKNIFGGIFNSEDKNFLGLKQRIFDDFWRIFDSKIREDFLRRFFFKQKMWIF